MSLSPTSPPSVSLTFRSALAHYASPPLPLESIPGSQQGSPRGGQQEMQTGSQTGWQRSITLPADAVIFAGHFPGHPVLPAVVQCLMAQMAVEEGLGRPLLLKAVCQAKFTAVLGPEQEITLRVVPARKPGQWDCTLHADDILAASLRLELEEASV